MSDVRDPEAPVENPDGAPASAPIAAAAPSAGLSYAVTLFLAILPIVVVALFSFLLTFLLAVLELLTTQAPFSELEPIRSRIFSELYLSDTHPLPSLITGVAANCLCFAGVAISLSRPAARVRLRLAAPRAADLLVGTIGLLGLTVSLDALLVLLELDDVGTLAEMRDAFISLGLAGRLLTSLVIAFGAGIGEELYFRGFLLTRLELAQNRVFAVVVTSLIFGAFHLDAVHSPVAAAMGAYLAVSLLITGSLWVPIVAHVVNNFCAVLLSDAAPDAAFATAAIPTGLVVCVLALASLRRRHRGEQHAPVW